MSLCIFQEKEASKARKVELFDLIVDAGCLVKVMTNKWGTSVRFERAEWPEDEKIRQFAQRHKMTVQEF